MGLKKFCDNCKKEIVSKYDDFDTGYSEWCLYHYKKRRDFCSKICLKEFIANYMETNL